MITLGNFYNLTVVRKSDLGYMLRDNDSEVLLHYKQSLSEHEVNDEVKVFIYADKERRLTATEITPFVTLDKPGYVNVVDVIKNVGVFVNINTPKDVLISKDYLPYNEESWPRVGEKLFVILKIKKDTLVAKPLNRFDVIALHNNFNYVEREKRHGIVSHIADKGIGIITDEEMYVYVPKTQLRGEYHLGEEVEVTITKKLDEEYYGSLNKNKEDMIDSDKELLLSYLNKNNGVIFITTKTDAEIIERELKMSKKAFKRAYGGLYKDRLIDFDSEKTFLVKK